MYTTSLSLLQRLRHPGDAAAWDRFVELYLPLLLVWARQLPLDGADPGDLVQEVFVKLVQELPTFSYDPRAGRFRGWLRRVCHNHWCDLRRKRTNHFVQANDTELAALAVEDDLQTFWDQDYNALLSRAAFRLIDQEFDAKTRQVFEAVVLEGRQVEEVARQLGLTANAVSMRKFRVLRRLRQELADFLD